jgi:hypothetical protein
MKLSPTQCAVRVGVDNAVGTTWKVIPIGLSGAFILTHAMGANDSSNDSNGIFMISQAKYVSGTIPVEFSVSGAINTDLVTGSLCSNAITFIGGSKNYFGNINTDTTKTLSLNGGTNFGACSNLVWGNYTPGSQYVYKYIQSGTYAPSGLGGALFGGIALQTEL